MQNIKPNKHSSFIVTIRSVGLALLTFIVGFFVIIGFIDGQLIKVNLVIGFILYDLLIAIACFYIVKQNPKSIWYAPLICNAYSIAGAFIAPGFLGALVLSIIASILGIRVAKRNTIDDDH
jgi:uncharacterized membrane protein